MAKSIKAAPKQMTKGLQSKVPAKTVRKKPAQTKKEVKDAPETKEATLNTDAANNPEVVLDKTPSSDDVAPVQAPDAEVQKITEKISVKYVFSQEEIGEKGIQLGRLHQNVEQIKDEIKEIVSLKKSQMEQSNASINELSRHVTNGYTFVDEVCNVKLMDPEPGKKSYYKMDGTFVETRSMMPMDFQAKMQFDLKTSQSDADDKAIAEMDHGKDRIRE